MTEQELIISDLRERNAKLRQTAFELREEAEHREAEVATLRDRQQFHHMLGVPRVFMITGMCGLFAVGATSEGPLRVALLGAAAATWLGVLATEIWGRP